MLLKLVSKVLVEIQESNLKTMSAGSKTGIVFLFHIKLGRECSGLSLCPRSKTDLQSKVKQRERVVASRLHIQFYLERILGIPATQTE